MAKLSTDELLDAFKDMTLLELPEDLQAGPLPPAAEEALVESPAKS